MAGRAGMTTEERRLYVVWAHIKSRCNNPRNHAYSYYGGRGIMLCSRWHSYDAFAADMGPHPGAGWTLDRRNNNSGYRPGNCRWATRRTQGQNTRACKMTLTRADKMRRLYKGRVSRWHKGMRQEDLAQMFGVSLPTVKRVLRGATWQR
jgi:hypothetical protein